MQIIYEDNDIAAVNKPAGVDFDWALKERQDFFVVHRLDKDTSGIILFAKNEDAQDYLRELFKSRQIKKSYLVLVVGKVKNSSGKIELSIGRSKKTPLKRVAIGEKRGKIREAVTEYKVLKKFEDYTFLEAFPKTGRTHQIRSHFAAIGHPVACDKLYSGKRYYCPGGISRQFLHAYSIEFKTQPPFDPLLAKEGKGAVLRLEAALPPELEKVLQEIKENDKNDKS
ncbi:RluA family pseudouridine synthase [Candidatus Giovannonibacteria bacterium]|nr:RluA family pseudouridine synthase [Candidatus Giovannonibacteria bacterium]